MCKHFIATKMAYEKKVCLYLAFTVSCNAICVPFSYMFMFKAIEMDREGKTFTGGHGSCEFNITYYKQRKRNKVKNDTLPVQPQLWKLATRNTLLRHSATCPGVLKLKARQLITHSGFRNQVCSLTCIHIRIKLCLSNVCYVVYEMCYTESQVARGAHTYGWRTSNMAEIGMAFAKKIR